jgi:hypothetical protein
MKNPKINTPDGVGELENVYVSELGFLMVKLCFKGKTFTTYNLGKHEEDNNIFTDKIINNVK